MTRKVIPFVLVVCMALALVLAAGCTPSNKVKVGFVFLGPINDRGWTESHYNGMTFLKDVLKVETMYRELIPEGPASKKAIKELINAGCNVIFTTKSGYMDATAEVAKEFPKVKFFNCEGYKSSENMSNYFGRIYEPRYLSGIVAGLKTETYKIGYLAAFEIPECISGINAFTLGVQSIKPNAVVKVRWTHTWIDSAKVKDAAVALLNDGCDVITQHNDSTAPQIAAQAKGAFAIGYGLDNRDSAPKAYLTAPVWYWGPYYVDQVKAIMDGNWKSSSYHGGIKEFICYLAPLTQITPSYSDLFIAAVQKKIVDGSLEVFKGPIMDQTGAIKVPEGKFLSYDEIMGTDMNWFVKGVEGKVEVQK